MFYFPARPARAQTVVLGTPSAAPSFTPFPLAGTSTIIEGLPATLDTELTSATFSWSATCVAAVEIKFFRPAASGSIFRFLEQRGPFDATGGQQTVALEPPVPIQRGDLIAITNRTSCGAPLIAIPGAPAHPPRFPLASVYSGDVTADVPQTSNSTMRAVVLHAGDLSLSLLSGRFRMTLTATDPRTGAVAPGVPRTLEDGAGYYSLPAFTGDGFFPEVMVKMVDATFSPALGGQFWLFHSPLTDLAYTLTVTDLTRQTTRTYGSGSGTTGPLPLCGGADTGAFPP